MQIMISKLPKAAFYAFVLCSFITCTPKKNQLTSGVVEQNEINIILLIGDGMGLSQISAAFVFQDSVPNFERFETIGLIKNSSATHKITDSAAGATAFSTGFKTYNGAIGIDSDSTNQKTLVEIASEQGMKTGLVVTSSITHATPASFYAHAKSREMAEEIATWLPESGVDYFAGGGLKYFNKRADNINYLELLEEKGFEIDTTDLNLAQEVFENKKYGYMLAEDGMPKSISRGDFLPNATVQALKYLSKSENGFFLMVEGSQIDWGGHENDSDYLIKEVMDFDKTLGIALDFAETHKNTLVIVTADHETGGFTLASKTEIDDQGVKHNNYDIIAPSFSTDGHSATLIPVFAIGPGSEIFSGVYENTEIFHKILEFIDNSPM